MRFSQKKNINMKKIIIFNILLYLILYIKSAYLMIRYDATVILKNINYLTFKAVDMDFGTVYSSVFSNFLFYLILYLLLLVYFYVKRAEYQKIYVIGIIAVLSTLAIQAVFVIRVMTILPKQIEVEINDIVNSFFNSGLVDFFIVFIILNVVFYLYLKRLRKLTK